MLLALPNVSNHSLMTVGQISSYGMLTSLRCFLTEGASAAVQDHLADGGSAEAISEMTTKRNSIHCLSSSSEGFSPPPSDNLHSLFIYQFPQGPNTCRLFQTILFSMETAPLIFCNLIQGMSVVHSNLSLLAVNHSP